MKARIELDEHFTFLLGLKCPSCGKWESSSIHTAFSGKEFSCDCGEEIRITPQALTAVQKEMEGLRSMFAGELEIPV